MLICSLRVRTQRFATRSSHSPSRHLLQVRILKPAFLLLATGGTMEATVKLVKQLGGEIAGLAFAVELDFLKGRDRFKEYDVFSLLHYDE